MAVKMTHEDEILVRDYLFLMREKRMLERNLDTMRVKVQKRFSEVDGLSEYFIDQSKRILDE
jgi:hypothetical protein